MPRILNRNGEIILKRLLGSDEVLSSSDIRETLNISRKTLAAGIQTLNGILAERGAQVRTVNGIGYALDVSDPEAFHAFSDEFLRRTHRDRYMDFDQNYLSYLIVLELLVHEGYTSLEMLVERYFYSSSTISHHLQKAKAYFVKFGLQLISRPNYGFTVQGSEWNRRICILFTAKIARGIGYLQDEPVPILGAFLEMLVEDQAQHARIKSCLEPVLQRHSIHLPMVYQMIVVNYVRLARSREERYGELSFAPDRLARLNGSRWKCAADEFAVAIACDGEALMERDIDGIAMLLAGYATRIDIRELDGRQLERNAADTRRMLERIAELYAGVESSFDEVFFQEFICLLAGLEDRLFFQLPSDEEVTFPVQHDGAFLADLCIDFARLFLERRGIRLATAELMQAYYVFASSFTRNVARRAPYRAALVSLYGVHFARDLATRLRKRHEDVFREIVAMELADANQTALAGFDLILTDISRFQFAPTKIPLVQADTYRDGTPRALDRHVVERTEESLREILRDSDIYRELEFRSREEVFAWLAEQVVEKADREDFLNECRQTEQWQSCERRNRIAMISTLPRYRTRREMVILHCRSSFIWDSQPVQMIVFFNRRGLQWKQTLAVNLLQRRLLGEHAGIATELAAMDAGALAAAIARMKK